MQIAYDFQTFFLQPFGGISRYFCQMACGIKEMGNQVRIIAPIHQNYYLRSLPFIAPGSQYVTKFPQNGRGVLELYNYIGSCIQIFNWRPDILHQTYYPRFGYGCVKGCKKVITVHDMIHELFRGDFPVSDCTAKLKRSAVEGADHVICISENTKFDLVRLLNVSEEKITVIHHGFDSLLDDSHSSSQDIIAKRPYLLYVGQRGGYKNFEGLLRAVANSPRLLSDFDMLAFGGGEFSPRERDLFESLGFFPEQIRHIAGDDNLLGSCYRDACAFVYPSLYEGFGLPPLEAMSCGCPVVSSNSSSMPEVIGNAAEYFDPRDPEDICRAIEAVVYSDDRALALVKAGKIRLSKYSWEKCSQETLEAYQAIL